MSKHERDAQESAGDHPVHEGYTRIVVRPDHIIFVEPIGYMTGPVIERLLVDLKQAIAKVQAEGYPVLILSHIGKITKHTSESRTAIKQAVSLPFVRGAAYGGSLALGLVMQYLQRSIDPNRAQYFRTEQAAVAYLQGEQPGRLLNYRATSVRFIAISIIIMILLSLATYASWNYTKSEITSDSSSIFSQTVQRTHTDLQKRMDVYVQALYGFRGLFNASVSVERDEFDDYFKSLNLTSAFPGLSGISFIKYVKNSEVAAYTAAVRSDTTLNKSGYPNFKIYPFTNKAAYDVVTYAEPNAATSMPGFDLSSDPARKATLDAARDSSQATASTTITFTSSPPSTGFLVTLPIYTGQVVPPTVALRQAKLYGFVNAVFRYNTLFTDAFTGLDTQNIATEIRDDQGQVVYTSGKTTGLTQTISNTLDIGGRALTVTFKAPIAYGLPPTAQQLPQTILNSGVFTLILLAVILGTLIRSRDNAIKLANTMTADLEHERNLAIENQKKLEQSEHDLVLEKASVEHKVVERTRELVEARAQLEASLDGLPFGFVILKRDHASTFANHAFSKIFSQTMPLNSSQTDIAFAKLSAKLEPKIDIAACARKAELERKIVYEDCMLGSRYLKLLFIPILTGDNDIIGSVIVTEDVTDEKALARAHDEFFSIASHELRTPLTAIRGNASMLLDTYNKKLDDPMFTQMVSDISSSSKHLIELVGAFLYVSELEQGKVNVKKERVDLGATASEVMGQFKAQAKDQKLTLSVKHAPHQTFAQADSDCIKQIITNLLSNALRFTKSGEITITITSDKGVAKLSVIDTGEGIPIEDQHLLFRKFQQASDNILTRANSQSTGLGLYISKLIAELMGGKLYLEKTEVSKGSSFVLELPRAE